MMSTSPFVSLLLFIFSLFLLCQSSEGRPQSATPNNLQTRSECRSAVNDVVVPCSEETWSGPTPEQSGGYDCKFGAHCIIASYASMLDPNEATSCSHDGRVCGYPRGSQASVRCGDGSAATVLWNAYGGGRYYNKIQAIVPGDIAGAFYSTGLTAQVSYATYDSAMMACNNE